MMLSKYLTPSQISKVYMVVGCVSIFVIAINVMTFLESEKKPRKPKPVVENVITNRNTREFGLDAVNDRVIAQKRQLEVTKKELEQLQQRKTDLEDKVKSLEQANHAQSRLIDLVDDLQQKVAQLEKSQKESDKKLTYLNKKENVIETTEEPNIPNVSTKHPGLKVNPERRTIRTSGFSYSATPTTDSVDVSSMSNASNDKGYSYVAADKRTEALFTIIESDVKKERQDKSEIYLPKGSILTGVLISGLDAPTAASAADTPVPVLVRVKKEAILPNYATLQEVNECFALMAGYGDLSSERAMLRGESITCVRKDKSVIEADFRSYAVGEDGKNGLKGTLVTRNSTVLANAMLAGFASGLSSMFNVNPVPVISTDSQGTQQYQDVFDVSALQGGAAKGASEAMDRLADYYMELADAIHPVIEVGAGRVVDMVVTTGTTL